MLLHSSRRCAAAIKSLKRLGLFGKELGQTRFGKAPNLLIINVHDPAVMTASSAARCVVIVIDAISIGVGFVVVVAAVVVR